MPFPALQSYCPAARLPQPSVISPFLLPLIPQICFTSFSQQCCVDRTSPHPLPKYSSPPCGQLALLGLRSCLKLQNCRWFFTWEGSRPAYLLQQAAEAGSQFGRHEAASRRYEAPVQSSTPVLPPGCARRLAPTWVSCCSLLTVGISNSAWAHPSQPQPPAFPALCCFLHLSGSGLLCSLVCELLLLPFLPSVASCLFWLPSASDPH